MTSKFHNARTNGYASRREANRAAELHALQAGKVITDLKEQVRFNLLPAMKPDFPRPMQYIADFTYLEKGVLRIEDAKGMKTPVYKLKRRLMKQLLGLDIDEV